jgi:hypothetical protein
LTQARKSIFIRPLATACSARGSQNHAELIFGAVGRTPGGFFANQRSDRLSSAPRASQQKGVDCTPGAVDNLAPAKALLHNSLRGFTMENADRDIPPGFYITKRGKLARIPTAKGFLLFRDRGLSDRTINALIDSGIDAPERLLFMTDADLKSINGLGEVLLGEIARYRSWFCPPSDIAELKKWHRQFRNGFCPKCNKQRTLEGYDPCIANLPGVRNACCGHGAPGYIQFENGVRVGMNVTDVTMDDPSAKPLPWKRLDVPDGSCAPSSSEP